MPCSLQVDNVSCAEKQPPLFGGVTFSVGPGETKAVGGASGSGKSALLEMCVGLRAPSGGTIRWDERPLDDFSRSELYAARRRMGFMFQTNALIANLTIFDNIALPLRYHGGFDAAEIRMKVIEGITASGLEQVVRQFPEALSVAQAKHAALERALVVDPELLVLDEPTAGLDREAEQHVIDRLGQTMQRGRTALLVATNSGELARRLSASTQRLANGRLRPGTIG
jgi:phospholipid/cholesterol/gamma-HCH transport system ATP-binding protein